MLQVNAGKGVGVMSLRTWSRIPLIAALASGGLAVVVAFAGSSAAAMPPAAPGVTPGAVGSTVYYTATDGSVWSTPDAPGAPVMFSGFGGHLVSAPAPISAQNGEVVFGQGTDNQLWSTVSTGTGWQPLGGAITSKPGAAVGSTTDSTAYSVFARGTDGAVWGRDHGGSVWGAWHSLGGQVLAGTGPAAAYTASDNQTWVAVTGTDHAIWYLNLINGVPQNGWATLQGKTNAGPALTAIPGSSGQPDALLAFARGTNDAGFYNEIVGGGQGWHSIGGRFTSGLAAGNDNATPPTTWVFGLGTDNQMYASSGTFPGSGFGSWGYVAT